MRNKLENSLSSPYLDLSLYFKDVCGGVSDGMNRGEIVIMHYPPSCVCHFPPYLSLPCIEDRPRPSQQDRRNTCRPFSKHYATCGVTFFWTRLVLLLSSQLSVCVFFVSSYAPQSPRHKCPDSRVAVSMGLRCMQHV